MYAVPKQRPVDDSSVGRSPSVGATAEQPETELLLTDEEIDILCVRLYKAATGANIHTANKAACYVKHGFNRDNDRSIKAYAVLVEKCEAALNKGEWKELGRHMRGWF